MFLKDVSLQENLPLTPHKDDRFIKQTVCYDNIYGYFLKYKATGRVSSMLVDARSKIKHYRKAVVRSLCRLAAIFPWIHYSVVQMDLQWSRILYGLIGKHHKCHATAPDVASSSSSSSSSSVPTLMVSDKSGLCCTYTIIKVPMNEVHQTRQRLYNLMVDLIMNLVFLESSYYYVHLSETEM